MGFLFNGLDGSLIRAVTNYANGWSGYTVASWIKSNLTNNDQGWFNLAAPDQSDNHGAVRYDAGGANGGGTNTMKFGLLTSGTVANPQVESASNVQTANVQFVVGRWSSGNQIEIWIDGVQPTPGYQTAVETGTIVGTTYTQLTLGAGPKETLTQTWDGIVYEHRVYNRALSQGEIETMYALWGADMNIDGLQLWYRDSGLSPGTTIPTTSNLIKDESMGGQHLTAAAAATVAAETVLSQRRMI